MRSDFNKKIALGIPVYPVEQIITGHFLKQYQQNKNRKIGHAQIDIIFDMSIKLAENLLYILYQIKII